VAPSSGPFTSRLHELDVPCTILPLPLLGRLRASLPGKLKATVRNALNLARFIRILRREQVDLIHTNTVFPLAGGMASLLLEIPHVWHLREGIDLPEYDFRFGRTATRQILGGLSTHMICISNFVRRVSVPENAQLRATVIPNALAEIPTEFTPPNSASPMVGALGLISRQKRTNQFVQAAALIAHAIPTARFIAAGRVGSGEEQFLAACRSDVAAAGLESRFSWPGFVSDTEQLYADLHLLIHAGVHEAFGRVLIEAMSRGIPVIGVRSGGVPEVVEDGVTGIVVPPDDAQALADAAVSLLSDRERYRAMSLRCRQQAAERFSPEAHVQQVSAVYRQLLP